MILMGVSGAQNYWCSDNSTGPKQWTGALSVTEDPLPSLGELLLILSGRQTVEDSSLQKTGDSHTNPRFEAPANMLESQRGYKDRGS